ncbi:DUF1918 domain-containing protein [Geodermatophilus sp. SYSU D00525]
MRAQVGDWLVVHGRRPDDGHREPLVLEVAHADGSPPRSVRRLDDERTGLVYPGPDATLRPGRRHVGGCAGV